MSRRAALPVFCAPRSRAGGGRRSRNAEPGAAVAARRRSVEDAYGGVPEPAARQRLPGRPGGGERLPALRGDGRPGPAVGPAHGARSEEHTSELQSLMRISYAVFCLKKKNKYNNTIRDTTQVH